MLLVGRVEGDASLLADLLGGSVVDAGRGVPTNPGVTVVKVVPGEEVLAEDSGFLDGG